MSRALLNNESVVRFIKENFVPVSGAVEHLQPGRYGTSESAASRWFAPIAVRAIRKYGPDGFFKMFGSYQGMYVVGPDGTPLDYKIGLAYDPDEFIQVLKSALNKSKKPTSLLPTANSSLNLSRGFQPAGEKAPRANASTSIIQVYGRICPLPANPTLAERSIGRDIMWIFPDELDQILERAIEPNKTVPMPPSVVARMVRFHLLNHVGNIMQPFSEKNVRRTDFQVKLVASQGKVKSFAFHGSYLSESKSPMNREEPACIEGSIEGRLSIDTHARKIVQFRAFGEAVAQGNNDSLAKNRKYPVVFAMREATAPISRAVMPFWAAVPLWRQQYLRPTLPR